MANVKRAALVKARARRVALDRDRQARDSRFEQAAARVFLGVEQRHVAERAVHDANVGIGKALLELLAERIALEDIAQLCDLDNAEVRRLVRLPALAEGSAGTAQPGVAAPAGAVDGAAGRGAAGPAIVTQLRRRPADTDREGTDNDIDAVAVAVSPAVPVPVDGATGRSRTGSRVRTAGCKHAPPIGQPGQNRPGRPRCDPSHPYRHRDAGRGRPSSSRGPCARFEPARDQPRRRPPTSTRPPHRARRPRSNITTGTGKIVEPRRHPRSKAFQSNTPLASR